ncbi:MAG: hypothetical protein A2X88_03660 [Deltaproteobacteria bacterium GWC2_65_14]|nr:MAG: hypothetical protein A2X88_03660 [Deltaproteobacteria bacterium GWC2_65_14]
MKKILAILVAVALVAVMTATPARAGDRGWATTGKILTGIIGVTILGNAIANAQAYHAPVYAPPPRVYYPPEQVWVPGRYETRYERRWVPGHWEIERFDRHGRGYDDDSYDDRPGRRGRRVWIPGYYDRVEMTVWIPGHWQERG